MHCWAREFRNRIPSKFVNWNFYLHAAQIVKKKHNDSIKADTISERNCSCYAAANRFGENNLQSSWMDKYRKPGIFCDLFLLMRHVPPWSKHYIMAFCCLTGFVSLHVEKSLFFEMSSVSDDSTWICVFQ